MTLTVEAIYENGLLRPVQELPLKEQEKVRLTIHKASTQPEQGTGIIPCTDPRLIEWAASDPELDFPSPVENLARLMAHAGSVDLGKPTGADNESIDADLAREAGVCSRVHESEGHGNLTPR